jgi:VanZ family protein
MCIIRFLAFGVDGYDSVASSSTEMKRFLSYWLPPIAWTAIILSASTERFSSAHSDLWLLTLADFLKHPLAIATRETLNFLVRKGAHLINYGILGALTFRALRGGRGMWKMRWAIEAIAIASFIASIDEIHQTFVPSRTGTWHDVIVDAAGAAAAQILIRGAQVLLFRPS